MRYFKRGWWGKQFLELKKQDIPIGVYFRVNELEDAIKDVVTQSGDNLCWMDAYTKLAKLVGIDFDPTVLSEDETLANCLLFVRSLKGGCPYRKMGYTGKYSIERLLHMSCGYCKKWWTISDGEESNLYFCPWCGKQQQFDKA